MAMEFFGSPKPTIGVEIELQVLDSETLDLTQKSDLLLQRCQTLGLKRVKAEVHQSMLEIDTEIAEDVRQCREFLRSKINQLIQIASDMDLRLAISGTHPFQRWADRLITREERYQNLHQKYQWLIRRMNVYGMHVHIGIKNGEQALAVSNALIKYLPHLLALSSNSPFWQGIDTGMQSSRVNIIESFPLAGTPYQFKSWKEFEHYCDTLSSIGAIRSVKDLYWHLRPNLQFGTLEFRICDAMSTLDETMALVALIQSLVVFASEKIEACSVDWLSPKEQYWIAPENQWIAARDGLDGIIHTDLHGQQEKISESIVKLIEQLAPTAKELNCLEELQSIHQIIKNGTGAKRQLECYRETQSLREATAVSLQKLEPEPALR